MCKFFSFVIYKGQKHYFGSEYRKAPDYEPDSHTRICETFLGLSNIKEDACDKYEYTADGLHLDQERLGEEPFEDVEHWAKTFAESREFWAICVRSISHGKDCLAMVPERIRKQTNAMIHEYACWCAEQCLSLYETKYPEDFRPRKAIETKRAWLIGKATDEELESASANATAAVGSATIAASCAAYSVYYAKDTIAACAAACAINAADAIAASVASISVASALASIAASASTVASAYTRAASAIGDHHVEAPTPCSTRASTYASTRQHERERQQAQLTELMEKVWPKHILTD